MKRLIFIILFLIGAFVAGIVPASASLTYSGSNGSLSAAANFVLTGDTLTITLTNTSTADVLKPEDVLTGLFFNTTQTLTPVSASLNGSSVFYGTATDAGDGWGYASGVVAQNRNNAISAANDVNKLGNSNFSSQSNGLDGLGYGILSARDDPSTGNSSVIQHGPLIKNSVRFTLATPAGFSLDELGSTVVFQYGTSMVNGPSFSGDAVPIPSAGLLFGPVLISLIALEKKYIVNFTKAS